VKVILGAVIVSLMVGLLFIGLVSANPHRVPAPPSISVWYSPGELFKTTLNVDIIVCYDTNNCTREAWYSVDGNANVSIPLTFKGMIGGSSFPASEVTGQEKTPILSGAHIITVYVKYDYGYFVLTGDQNLYIGQSEPTTPPVPELTIISPKSQATYGGQIQIIYSINANISWSYYALDCVGQPEGKDWIPFQGNITLNDLALGTHKLVVSVKPEGFYTYPVSEKTVSFIVNSNVINTSSSVDPLPTTSVPELSGYIILPLLFLALLTVLMVRFKKPKL
jgi:hypothetical protein